MNYLIAGAAQPIIWVADQLEPCGIPREIVKNVNGVFLVASGSALLGVTIVVSVIASIIFPALPAMTLGGLAVWGLTFGATKLVRFIPGMSDETKGSIGSVLDVTKTVAKIVGLNMFLPSIFVLELGVSMLDT
jgi:hypothetical protein